jgi:hypothetical protein
VLEEAPQDAVSESPDVFLREEDLSLELSENNVLTIHNDNVKVPLTLTDVELFQVEGENYDVSDSKNPIGALKVLLRSYKTTGPGISSVEGTRFLMIPLSENTQATPIKYVLKFRSKPGELLTQTFEVAPKGK